MDVRGAARRHVGRSTAESADSDVRPEHVVEERLGYEER